MGTALYCCLLRLRKMSHSRGQQDTAQQPTHLQQRHTVTALGYKLRQEQLMFLSVGLILYGSANQQGLCPFYLRQLGFLAKAQRSRLYCPKGFMLLQTLYLTHSSLDPFSNTHLYILAETQVFLL